MLFVSLCSLPTMFKEIKVLTRDSLPVITAL